MATIQSGTRAQQRSALSPPAIPMEHTPWFLWTLWALAGLLIVGPCTRSGESQPCRRLSSMSRCRRP
jgi:hypothetical protein